MSKKGKTAESPPLVSSLTQEEWILDIASTIAKLLTQLDTLNHATMVRADVGVKFSAYYNYSHVVKIDLTRLDKQTFFAEPLPIQK